MGWFIFDTASHPVGLGGFVLVACRFVFALSAAMVASHGVEATRPTVPANVAHSSDGHVSCAVVPIDC